MTDEALSNSLRSVQDSAKAIKHNIARVIIGKPDVIDLLLVALLSDGHVLIEDVPGMGKTIVAKALARSLGATFQRIQGTPDLLPTDITGVSYFDQRHNEFVFRPGPLFAQILLVDEINRATSRTQSALLEAMAERQVTVERDTMPLPKPFLVLATQNPVELEGTFPLPEAQLDRFFLNIQPGYPSEDEEEDILHRFKLDDPLESLQSVITAEKMIELQHIIRHVHWQPEVERYLLAIARATRTHASVQLGVSPRGTLALYRACEAYAALQGRDYVQPDDVKFLAPGVLAHRLLTTTRTRIRGKRNIEIIAEVVQTVPVPVETIKPPSDNRFDEDKHTSLDDGSRSEAPHGLPLLVLHCQCYTRGNKKLQDKNMRALLQRVSRASVTVGEKVVGEIGRGLLVLLGVGKGDSEAQVKTVADKIVHLRIFEDDEGKMNRSILEVGGQVLVVSQFTLYSDVRRGRRPSFTNAAPPSVAEPLVERFKSAIAAYGLTVADGIFGAYMEVELLNNGPVTIWLDSEEL